MTGQTEPGAGARPGGDSDAGGPVVLVVGGGTAGHIEPALAVGEAIRRSDPTATVIAVGTPKGLEREIVPNRGFPLELVDPVPLPRRLGADLAALPLRLLRAVRQGGALLRRTRADVVVGFGGYACVPVYLAAGLSRSRIPIVVHEANARAGIANKLGARFSHDVLAAVGGSGLAGAKVVGNPVRAELSQLDRSALRAHAREHFGLDPDAPTLLVMGGSQGARSLNLAMQAVSPDFAQAGVGVLHATGPKNMMTVPPAPSGPSYVTVPYLERMDLAYAAADLVVCRSGAITVAEIAAIGLPAVFVPLPIGNGEQSLNAADLVAAGAALLVDDADFTPEYVRSSVLPLASHPDRLAEMTAAAGRTGGRDAADVVARIALDAAGRRH